MPIKNLIPQGPGQNQGYKPTFDFTDYDSKNGKVVKNNQKEESKQVFNQLKVRMSSQTKTSISTPQKQLPPKIFIQIILTTHQEAKLRIF